MPFARSVDPIADLHARGFRVLALTPADDAIDIDDVSFGPRVALLVGAEGPGLAEASLARADVRARIPLARGFDSLNVATASGVALHVARRKLG